MDNSVASLIKVMQETDAGSGRMVTTKKDKNPCLAICVYFESDELADFLEDLDKLEEKYGLGV